MPLERVRLLCSFSSPFVVRGFCYARALGMYVPFLELAHPEGVCRIPLLGDIRLPLDGSFCTMCCMRSPESSIGLCSECAHSELGIWRQCVLLGAGYALGECLGHECPLSVSHLCRREYVLYVAVFGDIIKVGVTLKERGGHETGFVYRLLEQGADYAAVVSAGLALWDAQDLERMVAREYGLRLRVSAQEKLDMLSVDWSDAAREADVIAEEIAKSYGGSVIWRGSLDYWLVSDVSSVSDVLDGTVVGWKGNLLFVDDGSVVRAVDLSAVSGRGVICWEV